MNNIELYQVFVSSFLSGHPALLSNSQLRVEPIGDTLQLLAKIEGLVATAKLSGKQRYSSIRYRSSFRPQLHEAMIERNCLPVYQSKISGFYDYELIQVPRNYSVHFTNHLELLQTWWSNKTENTQCSLPSFLVLDRGILYPIQDLVCEHEAMTIQTSVNRRQINPSEMLCWLKRIEQSTPPPPPNQKTQVKTIQPQNRPHRSKPCPPMYRRSDVSNYPGSKRIGGYLVDAGLLSPAQVEVVLLDQELMGMRFGEVLVTRGWLKSQTIEFLFQNVILPQRTVAQKAANTVSPSQSSSQRHMQERVNKREKSLLPQIKVSPLRFPLKFAKKARPTSEKLASSHLVSTHDQETLTIPSPSQISPGPVTPSSIAAEQTKTSAPKLPSPHPSSVHDHETLSTNGKLNSEDLPDWIDLDSSD
ncbi:hypothetical protein [Acaryochloris sp. IP29b_bin.148]|uniref:hypothetical protein n=1 Tax=Acaryochloris sp. IP29b_bin.148 TaxID=2969218 RepID=UPI002631BE13|nr:hypothetical protein [Acaryochloris sp. IP29b_bin.148]